MGVFMNKNFVRASSALVALSVSPASAQQAPPIAVPGSEIIVTGTRRTERTAAQSTAPIDVVASRELAASPSTDLSDKLANSVPSFNVQRVPGADGAIFVRPAALRNLSPDQTQVLVNGHRRHRSAFIDTSNQGAEAVDLAQLPTAAIGRVEVLRDGASAQYGSDAIAGVINIILDDHPGTSFSAQTSQYYAGDGTGWQLSGRSGVRFLGSGSLAVAGEYLRSTETNRATDPNATIGQPDNKAYHLAYDVKLPIAAGANFYSFGTYGLANGRTKFFFRSGQARDSVFDRSFFQNGPNGLYPNYSLTSIYPAGFAARFHSKTADGEAVVGLKADVARKLTLDISGRYGRDRIAYQVSNSINASLGPLSPTRFDAGRLIASEVAANADATYLADVGLAKPLSIAFGAELRRERFRTIAGDPLSYVVGPLSDLRSGAYGFPGFTPASAGGASQTSKAVYLDTEADLTEKLTVGAAGRFERFSKFGSNFSYKIAGRYEPLDGVALRATYNTGFHAPSPGQQFFTKVSTEPDATKPAPFPITSVALVSPSDPLAIQFGGKPLTPEKSKNFSAGIVLQPYSGLTITADYYHIKISKRIGLTPEIQLGASLAFDKIQFLINGYDTVSNGFDVVASTYRSLLGGQASLTAAFNHNAVSVRHGDPLLVNKVLLRRVEDARPKNSAVVTGTFDRGRVHLLGRARYYGTFVDALPLDQTLFGFADQRVTSRTFIDVEASYDILSKTRLTVGAENLLGTYPDRNTGLFSFIGYKYPVVRPYEEDGGRWFVRLSQRI